ncbi:MAG: HAD hydrolase-like protein [bacterium]
MPCHTRHLFWDWNGTLLDDVDACVTAINVLLQRRGLPAVNRQRYVQVFDFPVRDYYRSVGFDLTHENWDDVTLEYHAAYAIAAVNSSLRPHTARVLRQLCAAGWRHSILSASEQGLLRCMVAERGILQVFDQLCGREDFHAHSKIEQGRHLLATLGLSPEAVLMIGDTCHDVEVACALGCRCLLVANGHCDPVRLAACGVPVVNDIPAVRVYISGWR